MQEEKGNTIFFSRHTGTKNSHANSAISGSCKDLCKEINTGDSRCGVAECERNVVGLAACCHFHHHVLAATISRHWWRHELEQRVAFPNDVGARESTKRDHNVGQNRTKEFACDLECLSTLGGHVTTHLTDLGLEKEDAGWINLARAALAILHHVDEMAAVILTIFDKKENDIKGMI